MKNAEVYFMAKKKIVRLTDEQYYKYIMSLKDEAALYGADGEMFVPDSLKSDNEGNAGD